MVFYTPEIYKCLLTIAAALILSGYFHFIAKKPKIALVLLIVSGLALRLMMALADPFLHTWDEKFHALVAKNMGSHPFKPMLFVQTILPYTIEDWSRTHIWVHKPPLFLWQMALSIKLFGNHVIAVRLPSVIMGTVSIFLVYDIARQWLKNINIAYVSSLLFVVSYYQLELTSGRLALDHNDIAFSFYVTASIWSYLKYLHQDRILKWACITGLFVGAAVLNKWLTGLLIYGGWGLQLLLSKKYITRWSAWKDLATAVVISMLVFIPWQVYITLRFPEETSIMRESNWNHIVTALGHPGSNWFHLSFMENMYGIVSLPFMAIGIVYTIIKYPQQRSLTLVLISMVVVMYTFFSLVVKTKMPAFTFPVNAILWIMVGSGLVGTISFLFKSKSTLALLIMSLVLAYFTLKPDHIGHHRMISNTNRNIKIENAKIYKNLLITPALKDRIVINCKNYEDLDLMFYKDLTAYHYCPSETIFDSLLSEGYQFAAWSSHSLELPAFIENHDSIYIINEVLH